MRSFGWLSRALVVAILVTAMAAPATAKKKRRKKKKNVPAKVEKAPTPPPAPAGPDGEDSRVLRRGERIEFDARLIQGQTAKAGAVYLFERASSNLRSMVNDKTSFRDKIIRTVFPKDHAKTKENEEKERGS